ncbi:hypothetical protein WMY93_001888 [Mugilogobius chulae]|uniref:Uncharacterized protein n=1 Tax=Mugilogobius chulae TaxID=88201 RepID=A0AAW0Q2X6_9GOBI
MLPEKQRLNVSDGETVEEVSFGFSSVLRFWLSKERAVCESEEKKERHEPRVVETKEEREITEEESEVRTEEETQEQSLAVSIEDESCPGPSAVFESEEKESKASAKTEEQTLCEEEEEEKEAQRPLDTGYDAFRDTFQELMREFDDWTRYQEEEIENLGQIEELNIVETDNLQDAAKEEDLEYATGSDGACSFYTDSEKELTPTSRTASSGLKTLLEGENSDEREAQEGESDVFESRRSTSSGTVIESSETNDSSEPSVLLHSLEEETDEETEVDKTMFEKFSRSGRKGEFAWNFQTFSQEGEEEEASCRTRGENICWFVSEDDSDSPVATDKRCRIKQTHFDESLCEVSDEIESSEVETEEKFVEDEIPGEEKKETSEEEQKAEEVESLQRTAEEEEKSSTSDQSSEEKPEPSVDSRTAEVTTENEDSSSVWSTFVQMINKWTLEKKEEAKSGVERSEEQEVCDEEENGQEQEEEERQVEQEEERQEVQEEEKTQEQEEEERQEEVEERQEEQEENGQEQEEEKKQKKQKDKRSRKGKDRSR